MGSSPATRTNSRVLTGFEAKARVQKGGFYRRKAARQLVLRLSVFRRTTWLLEECSPELLDEREKYWIVQKDSYKNGYNRTLGGGGIHGYQLTKEHKEKIRNSVSEAATVLGINRSGISNALRGKAKTAGSYHWEYSDEDRPAKYGSRQIICVETGKVYQSVRQAATELNINRSSISNVLRGKTQKAGGFHWKYSE